MKKLLLTLICVLPLLSCTNEDATVRTLTDAGYSEIKTTGYAFWYCSDNDHYHTGFQAKNPRGMIVEGAVCCGLMTKGCTIRF